MAGETSDALTLTDVSMAVNGAQCRRKYTAASGVVTLSNAATLTVTEYAPPGRMVYTLDGTNDAIKFPNAISMNAGTLFQMDLTIHRILATGYLLCNPTGIGLAAWGGGDSNNNKIQSISNAVEFSLDGVTYHPVVYLEIDVKFTLYVRMKAGQVLGFIGRKFDNDRHVNITIENFVIGDGSVYNYPLNDGWASNPTLANIGSGGNNAIAENFTEGNWNTVS